MINAETIANLNREHQKAKSKYEPEPESRVKEAVAGILIVAGGLLLSLIF